MYLHMEKDHKYDNVIMFLSRKYDFLLLKKYVIEMKMS